MHCGGNFSRFQQIGQTQRLEEAFSDKQTIKITPKKTSTKTRPLKKS